MWNEDSPRAQFSCYKCKKSFYNATALYNHKNQQHDIDMSDSEEEQREDGYQTLNESFLDLCIFKYLPRETAVDDKMFEDDGLTTRTFSADTSYLIVKVDSDRSRLDGMLKKNQFKLGKPPVDLRGPFTCTFPPILRPDLQCRKIFFNCCEFSLHYREEHTKRRKAALRCQVCEKRLDGEPYRPNHTIVAPVTPTATIRPTFSCRLCGINFLNSFQFDEHNRVIHAKTKPHQCSICCKRFTQQGGLQQHMRMHTGIRPFICTFCPKAFTQKAGLDQHLRTHTKVKPFKCVICSKCFSQSVHLRQHMRTHTNIQPFECSLCGRRFKQSSHLNFHMRSHVGDPSSLTVEQYAHAVQQQGQLEFLSLANVKPVQDGETLYYAAELADPQIPNYGCQPHGLPEGMLTL